MQQRRDVIETGFLSASERSMFTEGKKNEALLRYINPDVNWRSSNKVLIDSLMVWKYKDTQNVSSEDLKKLTDFLYGLVWVRFQEFGMKRVSLDDGFLWFFRLSEWEFPAWKGGHESQLWCPRCMGTGREAWSGGVHSENGYKSSRIIVAVLSKILRWDNSDRVKFKM